jgi:hypothetical protein
MNRSQSGSSCDHVYMFQHQNFDLVRSYNKKSVALEGTRGAKSSEHSFACRINPKLGRAHCKDVCWGLATGRSEPPQERHPHSVAIQIACNASLIYFVRTSPDILMP